MAAGILTAELGVLGSATHLLVQVAYAEQRQGLVTDTDQHPCKAACSMSRPLNIACSLPVGSTTTSPNRVDQDGSG